MQTLQTFEKALKDNYLPAWNNMLSTEPSPLLGKVKKIPLKSDKIVASARIGLSGGFGYGAEGAATPASGAVRMERFETRSKDMYVNICISQKAVELGTDSGAMANALKTEIDGAYETAKWNVGRSLYGNGTGVLTSTQAVNKVADTLELDDLKNVKAGLIVDVYEGNALKDTVRIIDIDRAAKTAHVKSIKNTGAFTSAAAGFITVQNSYNREITGLGAIFDEKVTSIYGVEKASNPFIVPIAESAGNDINDSVITRVLRLAKNEKNSNVDMLLAGDAAYDAYTTYLRENNIRVESMTHTITGGFNAIKFAFGNKEIDIVNESFIPDGDMWGVETGKLEFHQKDWKYAQLQGGGIFNLMENQSVYRALLTNYGELICTNPGGCVRIKDCA